jgi:cytochrome P450
MQRRTEVQMTDLAALVRIDDPQFYIDDPYPVFARLRKEAPAFYCESLDTFVISRYEDVRRISRNPEVWSVADGQTLNDAKYKSHVTDSFFPEGAERLMTTDPPRHRELRRVISPVFTPRNVGTMEESIRLFTRQLLDTIDPGKEIDFVEEIAVVLPLWTVARLLGLAGDNFADLRYWTDEMVKMGGDLTPEELSQAAANFRPLNEYLLDQLERKRRQPDDGLLSVLVRAGIDNEKLTDVNVLMLSTAVLLAGNATTRNLLSGILATLADHPAQREILAADLSLCGNAVDETLRYVTPVLGFLRTALSDTEVAGQAVAKGQRAYLMYMSANHDETIFENPDCFDVTRPSDPGHVAFGFGEHVCPGSSLARLECRVLLEELLPRFPTWEVTGTPRRVRSVLENAWSSLPITFHS